MEAIKTPEEKQIDTEGLAKRVYIKVINAVGEDCPDELKVKLYLKIIKAVREGVEDWSQNPDEGSKGEPVASRWEYDIHNPPSPEEFALAQAIIDDEVESPYSEWKDPYEPNEAFVAALEPDVEMTLKGQVIPEETKQQAIADVDGGWEPEITPYQIGNLWPHIQFGEGEEKKNAEAKKRLWTISFRIKELIGDNSVQ